MIKSLKYLQQERNSVIGKNRQESEKQINTIEVQGTEPRASRALYHMSYTPFIE